MLPCVLSCYLSDPLLSCPSYIHLSILGLSALFFFSLVCPHLAFFSLCAPLSFSSHGRTLHSFYCNFVDACTTLVVPIMCSFRNVSLLVTPHIHLSILISFTSSRAYCPITGPGLCTIQQSWPDHSFVNFSLREIKTRANQSISDFALTTCDMRRPNSFQKNEHIVSFKLMYAITCNHMPYLRFFRSSINVVNECSHNVHTDESTICSVWTLRRVYFRCVYDIGLI